MTNSIGAECKKSVPESCASLKLSL